MEFDDFAKKYVKEELEKLGNFKESYNKMIDEDPLINIKKNEETSRNPSYGFYEKLKNVIEGPIIFVVNLRPSGYDFRIVGVYGSSKSGEPMKIFGYPENDIKPVILKSDSATFMPNHPLLDYMEQIKYNPKVRYLGSDPIKKIFTNKDLPPLNVTIADIKYICLYINAKTSMKSMVTYLERLASITKDLSINKETGKENTETLSIGVYKGGKEIVLKYNPNFIRTAVLEDYVMKYTDPVAYARHEGVLSTLAFCIGHEMLHFRYGHLNSSVQMALTQAISGGLKTHPNKNINKLLRNIMSPTVYEHEELMNNVYLERKLKIPTVDCGATSLGVGSSSLKIPSPPYLVHIDKFSTSIGNSESEVGRGFNEIKSKLRNNIDWSKISGFYAIYFEGIPQDEDTKNLPVIPLKSFRNFSKSLYDSKSYRTLAYYDPYFEWNKITAYLLLDSINEDGMVKADIDLTVKNPNKGDKSGNPSTDGQQGGQQGGEGKTQPKQGPFKPGDQIVIKSTGQKAVVKSVTETPDGKQKVEIVGINTSGE